MRPRSETMLDAMKRSLSPRLGITSNTILRRSLLCMQMARDMSCDRLGVGSAGRKEKERVAVTRRKASVHHRMTSSPSPQPERPSFLKHQIRIVLIIGDKL